MQRLLTDEGVVFLRVCLLASGSKGNAVYIECGDSRILIDAGLSAREIERRLAALDVAAEDLNAILVTHEHNDHTGAVGPLARRHRLPVHIHPRTLAAARLGRIDAIHEFDTGEPFALRDFQITPFPVTHDAAETVGFILDTPSGRVGVATDLGLATRLVSDSLRDCRVLVLESNHDESMLRDGPYPWPLKQRIAGRHGHLSNHASAELLDNLLWEGAEAVFLAHLSETNNDPKLAEKAARAVIDQQNFCAPQLIVGCQQAVSDCFEAR